MQRNNKNQYLKEIHAITFCYLHVSTKEIMGKIPCLCFGLISFMTFARMSN